MKEVKKLNKFHLAMIDMIIKNPKYHRHIEENTDGTCSYVTNVSTLIINHGTLPDSEPTAIIKPDNGPLRIDHKNGVYTLTVKTEDGGFSYKETAENIGNNPESEIGKLLDVFIKEHNKEAPKRAKLKKEITELLARKM